MQVPVVHYRTYATAAVKAFDRTLTLNPNPNPNPNPYPYPNPNQVKAFDRRLLDAAAARRVVEAVEADMALDSVNLAPGSANAVLLMARLAARTLRTNH
eukprot:scaffold49759_cov44-Phaeocystis_antarctica.AAC.1